MRIDDRDGGIGVTSVSKAVRPVGALWRIYARRSPGASPAMPLAKAGWAVGPHNSRAALCGRRRTSFGRHRRDSQSAVQTVAFGPVTVRKGIAPQTRESAMPRRGNSVPIAGCTRRRQFSVFLLDRTGSSR